MGRTEPQGELVEMPMSTVGRSTRVGKYGFTLFELIVVIALLGIMAGVVVPYVSFDVGGGAPEEVIHNVQAVLDQARTHARLTRANLTIVFTPKSMAIRPEGGVSEFPDNASFEGLVLAGSEKSSIGELAVDSRGIVPAAIVRIKVAGKLYSLLINPVLREVDVREGLAEFADFSN